MKTLPVLIASTKKHISESYWTGLCLQKTKYNKKVSELKRSIGKPLWLNIDCFHIVLMQLSILKTGNTPALLLSNDNHRKHFCNTTTIFFKLITGEYFKMCLISQYGFSYITLKLSFFSSIHRQSLLRSVVFTGKHPAALSRAVKDVCFVAKC